MRRKLIQCVLLLQVEKVVEARMVLNQVLRRIVSH